MSQHILERPKPNFIQRLVENKVFWILAVVILFTVPLMRSFQKKPVEQLPVYGQLSEFRLDNQDGREITSREFVGSVLLVNFIFTRCPDVCPRSTRTMAKVQERLKGTAKNVQLVSITVDPDHDRPEVLKDYAEKYFADTKIWTFLTGSMQEIRDLVVGQFKSAIDGEVTDGSDFEGLMELSHGEHFVLVDQVGQIRGYRTLGNQQSINAVVKDLVILVNSFPPNESNEQAEAKS